MDPGSKRVGLAVSDPHRHHRPGPVDDSGGAGIHAGGQAGGHRESTGDQPYRRRPADPDDGKRGPAAKAATELSRALRQASGLRSSSWTND